MIPFRKKEERYSTLPKTNSSPSRLDGWEMKISLFGAKKKQAYFQRALRLLSLEPKFLGRFGRTTNYIEDSKTMNPGSWIVMEFSFQNWVLLSDCVLQRIFLSPGAEKNCQFRDISHNYISHSVFVCSTRLGVVIHSFIRRNLPRSHRRKVAVCHLRRKTKTPPVLRCIRGLLCLNVVGKPALDGSEIR